MSARRKVSFCLRDTARVPVQYGAFDYGLAYGMCTKRSPQGISIGWMDIYQSFLAGQALRLPDDLPNGLYCLETVVDPIDQLVETEQRQQLVGASAPDPRHQGRRATYSAFLSQGRPT